MARNARKLAYAGRNCPQFLQVIRAVNDGHIKNAQIFDGGYCLRVRRGAITSLRREQPQRISGQVLTIGEAMGTVPHTPTPEQRQVDRPVHAGRRARGRSGQAVGLKRLIREAHKDMADPHFQQTPDQFAARSGVSRGTVDVAVKSGTLTINEDGKIEPTSLGMKLLSMVLATFVFTVCIELLLAVTSQPSLIGTLLS